MPGNFGGGAMPRKDRVRAPFPEKRQGESAFPGEGNARDQELMALKRKLAKVEQERDFLKEAAAYFARESK
jgi:transposase-like protein